MNEAHNPPGPYKHLTQATVVLLMFQAAFLLAQLFNDEPYSGTMTGVLAATVAVSTANRRLFSETRGRHATAYVMAWRYGILILLGALSIIVALRAYVPEATPNATPTLIAMLLSAVIALKGALLGKLQPGGVLGLRLRWTCQSRLAWEKAHRLMGRILFWGGLVGILAAPFVPYVTSFIWTGGVVLIGVTAASIESQRVWKNDPERTGR